MKKKAYNDENQIIAAIDELQAKAKNLLRDSVEFSDKGKHFIRNGNGQEDKLAGEELLTKAATADRQAQRCSGELQKLKDALAAFRTDTLPLVIPKDKKQFRVVV